MPNNVTQTNQMQPPQAETQPPQVESAPIIQNKPEDTNKHEENTFDLQAELEKKFDELFGTTSNH